MEVTSMNSSNDYKLVNFNVPKYLITNFDYLVKFKRVSRTSMLIHLMESYIRREKKLMEEDNSLNKMLVDVQQRNRKELFKNLKKDMDEEYEPPMIPLTTDRSWDDYLKDTNQREDWSDISGVGFLDRLGR